MFALMPLFLLHLDYKFKGYKVFSLMYGASGTGMTEIMPVLENLSFTFLPTGSSASGFMPKRRISLSYCIRVLSLLV